jgi:hypothetical protein
MSTRGKVYIFCPHLNLLKYKKYWFWNKDWRLYVIKFGLESMESAHKLRRLLSAIAYLQSSRISICDNLFNISLSEVSPSVPKSAVGSPHWVWTVSIAAMHSGDNWSGKTGSGLVTLTSTPFGSSVGRSPGMKPLMHVLTFVWMYGQELKTFILHCHHSTMFRNLSRWRMAVQSSITPPIIYYSWLEIFRDLRTTMF